MKLKLTAKPALTLRLPPFSYVNLTLVGCGGTGSHLASAIAACALALHERSIYADVFFIDHDRVERKNVGRQNFGESDLGKAKAAVLAERMLNAYGLAVGACVGTVDDYDVFTHPAASYLNIVIGAVDNAAARSIIAKAVTRAKGKLWWLDCGNENHSGQVCIGNVLTAPKPALGYVDGLIAPHVRYPDLIKAPKLKRAKAASCAELTESGEQGLMVNRLVAAYAATMLNDFLMGTLKFSALSFDARQGGVKSYAVGE